MPSPNPEDLARQAGETAKQHLDRLQRMDTTGWSNYYFALHARLVADAKAAIKSRDDQG